MNEATLNGKLQQAVQLQKTGRIGEAELLYRQILDARPDHPDALNLLGVVASLTSHHTEALDLIGRAIAVHPVPEFYRNLALVLMQTRRFDEALAAYQKCLSLNPLSFEASRGLGDVLCELDKPLQAATAYQRSLALKPDEVSGLLGLGNALYLAGEFDEAMGRFARAVELSPEIPATHCARAPVLLAQGDYEHGWQELEWRWLTPEMMHRQSLFGQPRWYGSDLNGTRILLHADGTCGDTFNLVRYIPLVAQRGGKVLFRCQPEARSLMLQLQGVEQFLEQHDPLIGFDVHCSLLSLPAIFQTTLQNIPSAEPYLAADPAAAELWKNRMPSDGRLKVGLALAGDLHSPGRSVPPAMLAPLADIPNLWLCSVQPRMSDAQLAAIPPELKITNWSSELKNYADMAALIANLDLVICVDGNIAHLAGAMGKPVWVLLRTVANYHWLLEREDSPWYPTARLFRQKTFGDWSIPVGRMIDSLRELAAR